MATVLGNKVVKNVGTSITEVIQATAFYRYTLLGLSITNVTNTILEVDVLIDGAHYLSKLLLPTGTSLRAVTHGEKLVLGYNSTLSIKSSVDNSIDVVVSYAAVASQAFPNDVQLSEGPGINLFRNDNNDITIGVDLSNVFLKIAADDSNIIQVPLSESIKFIGGNNITTYSDSEGNLTIEGPDTSSYITNSDVSFTITTEDSVDNTINIGSTLNFIGSSNISVVSDGLGNFTFSVAGVDVSNFVVSSTLDNYVLTSALSNYVENNDVKIYLDAETKVNQNNFVGINDTLNFVGIGYMATTLNGNQDIEIRWNGENIYAKIADINFTISADDNVTRQKTISDNIKFKGGVGISTTSDNNGDITINSSYELDPIIASVMLG